MNAQSKILFFLFVAVGVPLVCGCAVNAPITEEKPEKGIYFAVDKVIGIEPVTYKAELGKKIKTTPVHPDDSGFLSGETATEPDSYELNPFRLDCINLAPNVGLLGSVGSENLRFVGGLLARWNLLHYWDGYQQGLYSVKQQVSDVRSSGSGSFVFTQVRPDLFTFIPSVGIIGKSEKLTMELDMGFPYMGWEVRSGHDRWAKWETVQYDSWRDFGIRYTGTLGFNPNGNDNTKFFISIFYEEYRPEFAGEEAKISGIGGFLGFIAKW